MAALIFAYVAGMPGGAAGMPPGMHMGSRCDAEQFLPRTTFPVADRCFKPTHEYFYGFVIEERFLKSPACGQAGSE